MGYVENVLSAKQEQYLAWLCTAPQEREPSSKKKYVEVNHVGMTTLLRWEKLESFRAVWQRTVDDVQGSPERTQNLLDTLYKNALNGDTKSAALWLQTTGRMKPQEISVKSAVAARALTEDQLDELIGRVAAAEKLARNEDASLLEVG